MANFALVFFLASTQDVKQDDSQPTAASEHDAKMIKNVLMIGASGEVGGAVARSVVAGGHKLHALLRYKIHTVPARISA